MEELKVSESVSIEDGMVDFCSSSEGEIFFSAHDGSGYTCTWLPMKPLLQWIYENKPEMMEFKGR